MVSSFVFWLSAFALWMIAAETFVYAIVDRGWKIFGLWLGDGKAARLVFVVIGGVLPIFLIVTSKDITSMLGMACGYFLGHELSKRGRNFQTGQNHNESSGN